MPLLLWITFWSTICWSTIIGVAVGPGTTVVAGS